MNIDLNGAPQTAALVQQHEQETAALPMNPDPVLLARHAQRQVIELLCHAADLERQVNGLLRDGL